MQEFFSSRNLMKWMWLGLMIFAATLFAQSEDIKFEHISLEQGLSQATVFCILQDSKGFMWFGTQDGLNKYDGYRFTIYKHDPNNPRSISHNMIWFVHEDRTGILWIATNGGGLNRFDRGSESFTRFQHDPYNPRSLSSDLGCSIYQDRSGVLWIGTAGGGVNRFERESETFTRFQHDPDNPRSLSDNFIRSFCEDRSGALWIATNEGGINRFDRNSETFTRFQHDPDNPRSLSHNFAWRIYEDHSGVLWIGTAGAGLDRYNRDNETFMHFQHDPDNPRSLSDNFVTAIQEDRAGVLWIGTRYGGLSRFVRASETFIRFTEKEGLSNNLICGILEDDQGNLWISTANGLSKFNPETGTFRNYDMNDGLQSNEFNVGAYFQNKSGEMFFGGINGFNAFFPDSIRDNPYIPPVFITAFERFNADSSEGTPIIEKGISEKEHIQLSYKDNILTFEFAALNYRNTLKNRYAYKLEGFTENWIQLGTERRVAFTNLDPGEYTLRVKGSNNDGVWNEEGTSLRITITPPWWKTWWAYTLYGLFVLGLLYGVRRYELNHQPYKHELEIEHLEKEKVQEVERMKSRFFANLSHEFRTPLTLIQGPVQQLRSGEFKGNLKEQYDLILRNCNRLLRLINQLLDLSKLESGSMTLQARPENIVELTRQLTMAFESLAKRKGIDLRFQLPGIPNGRDPGVFPQVYIDRDKYEKIVTNLLSNAFKFTAKGGEVIVGINPSQPPLMKGRSQEISLLSKGGLRGVEIRVSDTGIGIAAAHLPHIFDRFFQVDDSVVREHGGTGIGLALTKELVELHHGEILVTSEVGKGTIFTVRLPLGKEHLQAEEIVERGAWSEEPFDRLRVKSGAKSVSSDQEIPDTGYFALTNEAQESVIEYPESSIEHLPNGQSSDRQITKSPNILIVEDNPDMRAYIRNSLRGIYRIIEAKDGTAGFKTALKAAPDLIVSDVMMPRMDGYQFCEKIKSDPRTSHIPVILLTAKASRDSKLEGLETGADDYLTKPFDAEELQMRIRNLIEQRRKLRELFQRELKVEPQNITVTSADEKFLRRAMEIVEEHMGDSEFDTVKFSQEIGIGRSQLNVKLRALTGNSTREFIHTLRLKRAAQLLQQRFGNVAEIAYEVGFNSLSHFSKAFKEQFGVLPSGYGTKQQSTEKS